LKYFAEKLILFSGWRRDANVLIALDVLLVVLLVVEVLCVEVRHVLEVLLFVDVQLVIDVLLVDEVLLVVGVILVVIVLLGIAVTPICNLTYNHVCDLKIEVNWFVLFFKMNENKLDRFAKNCFGLPAKPTPPCPSRCQSC